MLHSSDLIATFLRVCFVFATHPVFFVYNFRILVARKDLLFVTCITLHSLLFCIKFNIWKSYLRFYRLCCLSLFLLAHSFPLYRLALSRRFIESESECDDTWSKFFFKFNFLFTLVFFSNKAKTYSFEFDFRTFLLHEYLICFLTRVFSFFASFSSILFWWSLYLKIKGRLGRVRRLLHYKCVSVLRCGYDYQFHNRLKNKIQ